VIYDRISPPDHLLIKHEGRRATFQTHKKQKAHSLYWKLENLLYENEGIKKKNPSVKRNSN
jgi:hypothetical protein